MTVPSTARRNDYIGNGATSVYSYTYRIFSSSDLLVTVRNTANVETTLALSTNYTVTGVGDASGGSITLLGAFAPLPTSHVLTIRRVRPITQTTDIRNQGEFFPETHEDAFDHFIMVDQQQDDEIDRSIKIPETVDPATVSMILPVPVANQGFRWNATATALENFTLASSGTVVLPGSSGIAVYMGANTFASRTITAGAGIAVTNGDGVAGNPTIAVDITGATALTAPATGDELLIYDLSATEIRKITLGNFITGHTAETAPVGADEVLIYDVSATAVRKMTLNNFLVTSHVVETAPDTADEALFYDTSATSVRKITLRNFLVAGHATFTAPADSDKVLVEDDSAAVLRKISLQNLIIAGWPQETVSAGNDQAVIYDSSAAALRRIDLSNLTPSGSITQAKYATGSITLDKFQTTTMIDANQTIPGTTTSNIVIENTGQTTDTKLYLFSVTPTGSAGSSDLSCYLNVDCNNGDVRMRMVNASASSATVRLKVYRLAAS